MGGKDGYRGGGGHLQYFVVDKKNTAKRLRTQGKHMKFCSDGSVATLLLRCSFICNELCFIHLVHYHIFGRIINFNVLVETLQ